MTLAVAVALLVATATHLVASEGELVIETASGEADELAIAALVRRVIDEHELGPWLFTRRILIDRETRIPHSHPVLTLNTDYEKEIDVLAGIVHEQFHWYVLEDQEALGAAVGELRERYPEAPDGPPEGARDLQSTYLHLIVCSLEYAALAAKVGRTAAEENLLPRPYYRWVYRTVVSDREALREILERHGLGLP